MTVSPSPFARVLQSLLDDNGVRDRAGWAAMLGVKEENIQQWLADVEFPSAERLYIIVEAVKATNPSSAHLKAFHAMAAEFMSDEISPCWDGRGPRIVRYIQPKQPPFPPLAERIAGLDVEEQDRVVREAFHWLAIPEPVRPDGFTFVVNHYPPTPKAA